MKNFIVFNPITEEIIKTGYCSDRDFELQSGIDELILEGTADDIRDKVITYPVGRETEYRRVRREQSDIDTRLASMEPKIISLDNRQTQLTNKEYQQLLDRVSSLESR